VTSYPVGVQVSGNGWKIMDTSDGVNGSSGSVLGQVQCRQRKSDTVLH